MRVLLVALVAAGSLLPRLTSQGAAPAWPEAEWERRDPEAVGLSAARLTELQELVGGRGCVVRHGYLAWTWGDYRRSSDVASAFKPLLSTLLLMAVQEGRLASVHAKVSDFEPMLDRRISWFHLASQLSGYGLTEEPGAAYAYNDFALALYYDTLTGKVFRQSGDDLLRTRLAEPLRFQDRYTFEAFGPRDRPGRLAVSVRDFARFGLLWLRMGNWRGKQLVQSNLVHMALHSPVPPQTPLTRGKESPMLPGQRTIGGTRNITPVGPGYYSFNWWLNRTNEQGQRLFADAPPDTYVASGHGGKRMLWVVPTQDMVVCWNDSVITDHDRSPGNPESKCNQAARLIVESTKRGP